MADTNLIPVNIIPDQADPLSGGSGGGGGGTTGFASGTLSGNTLTLTANDGSTITVNVASLMDDTNLARITSAALAGATLTLTRDDTTTVTVDLSGLQTTFGAATTAADDATGAGGTSTDAARADHKHAAQAPSADANNAITVGTDGLHFTIIPDEVVRSSANLTGAAPGGAEWGINTTTGAAFFVDPSGNWQPVPTATVDMNLTVEDASGNDMGLAPLSPPASPDDGDVHLEVYDDGARWFTRTAGAWVVSASFTGMAAISPATAISPAADDATGNVGTAPRYAREDHKHPAQGVSSDAEQMLKAGSDGLHMLDPDDLISADADNQLTKGTDAKLFVPEGAKVTFHNATGANLGAVPASAPAGAKVGDIHIESYDDGVRWFQYFNTPPLPAGWQTALTHTKATGKTRLFISNATMQPSAAGEPTDAEAQAIVTAGGAVNYDRIVYYTGTDASTDDATYAWLSDPINGKLTRVLEPAASAKNRVFLSNTAVNPSVRLQPTDAEATSAIGGATNVVAYYTGTDTATDPASHTWHVDAAGNVTRTNTQTLTPRGTAINAVTLSQEGVYTAAPNVVGAPSAITLPAAVGSQEVRVLAAPGVLKSGKLQIGDNSYDDNQSVTVGTLGVQQTFVSPVSGDLERIGVNIDSGQSGFISRWSLYDGEGTSGTLINGPEQFNSDVDGSISGVTLVKGQIYTLHFTKQAAAFYQMNTTPDGTWGYDVVNEGVAVSGRQLVLSLDFENVTDADLTGLTTAVVSVQSGELLKGVVDGTANISGGDVLIAVDAAVGEWSVGLFSEEPDEQPAAVTPTEDARVKIGSGTGGYQSAASITSLLDGTATWSSVASEYEKIEIVWSAQNGSGGDNRKITTVDASQLVADTELTFFYNGSFFAAMTLGSVTAAGGPVATFFGGYSAFEVAAVYGIRAQKVEIPSSEATVVHDQNNYLDIGNKRIQWGVQAGNDAASAVSLPQAFANSNYVVTFGVESAGAGISITGGGDVDFLYWIVEGSKTTTQFSVDRDNDIDNADLNWLAIGDKP